MSENRITLRVEGIKEIQDSLKELPRRVAKNVSVRALSAAMVILREAARAKVPVDEGDLKRSIRVVKRKQTYAEIIVNVECVKAIGYYAHMIEYGHRLIRVTGFEKGLRKPGKRAKGAPVTMIRRKKVHWGTILAHPFMRPALDAVDDAVIDKALEELARGCEKEFVR